MWPLMQAYEKINQSDSAQCASNHQYAQTEYLSNEDTASASALRSIIWFQLKYKCIFYYRISLLT